MRKLTDYEKDFRERMKDKEFREAYEKERRRVAIAYEIVKLREKSGCTQKQLAKKLDTTQSVIARMEGGNQNFTVDNLEKVASAFNKELNVRFV